MKKYIDAEKLIERLEEMKLAEYENCGGVNSKTGALQEVQELIDSLQQEQPTNTDTLCSELADFLIRNDIPKEKAQFIANRIADIYGSKRYIDGICDGLDMNEQERPEVDLEKEIEEHVIYMPHGEFASDNEIIEDMEWARKEFRHFYGLGLNARKK